MRLLTLTLLGLALTAGSGNAMTERAKLLLDNTQPLKWERGNRLPLLLWPAIDCVSPDEPDAEATLLALNEHGLAAIASWQQGDPAGSLDKALRLAKLQRKLDLPICVDANSVTYRFFNGDEALAHVDAEGKPFWDTSCAGQQQGCPFALEGRIPAMKAQVEYFAKAYEAAGIAPDFVFADWEIDGPLEWNGAWEASKRCSRCQANLRHIEDFREFQRTLRSIRSRLQREAYAEPLTSRFPDALVGNYAVYPNDGWRYWYDYFEDFAPDNLPYRTDQKARYREWYQEFPETGFTYGMPVVYTWYRIFDWYGFENPDYRWFYNLLMVGTNAAKSTPADLPLISFVHWHTTSPPPEPAEHVVQMSPEAYQELLWHLLLRGMDDFFLWCPSDEAPEEVRLLHEVWAASLEYHDFLTKGKPVSFEVPTWEGPVISGLRLGNQVLVRRSDFDEASEPVTLTVDGKPLAVPRAPGVCQILELPD